MMPKLSILTALLLSAAGTSALSIADLGLMVLPDQGNAKNTDKCTATEFNNLAVDLDETARTFQDNYTRKLQSSSSVRGEESMDLDIADATQGQRKLNNCAALCSGFPYGHCKVVYPICAPRRDLEEVGPVEATAPSLRGSERQLQQETLGEVPSDIRNLQEAITSTTVDANGYMLGYGVDHPQAAALCEDLKAGLINEVLSIPNKVPGMTPSCKNLWRKSPIIGCVYMSAV
jgi:hypothetical protein